MDTNKHHDSYRNGYSDGIKAAVRALEDIERRFAHWLGNNAQDVYSAHAAVKGKLETAKLAKRAVEKLRPENV